LNFGREKGAKIGHVGSIRIAVALQRLRVFNQSGIVTTEGRGGNSNILERWAGASAEIVFNQNGIVTTEGGGNSNILERCWAGAIGGVVFNRSGIVTTEGGVNSNIL
jgi:hypothetical protein